MTYVICILTLYTSTFKFDTVQVRAKLVNDDKNMWVIDISEFLKTHDQYKEFTNEVFEVESNSCGYAK